MIRQRSLVHEALLAAGLLWRPIPGAENAEPPYELRPGTGRRGPAELWERFDAAVSQLNRAITGSDAAAVADAFGELSQAAGELADAITHQDAATQPAHSDARARRSMTKPLRRSRTASPLRIRERRADIARW